MKASKQTFSDGSSLEVLENGSYILLETKTAKRVLIAQETPVNYSDPPPPLPPGTQLPTDGLYHD